MKIIKKNRPNHYNGRDGWKADMIVCHQTGGDKVSSAINWFLSPASQVSAHFVVDTDGTVYQFVELDNAAWCNGTSTDQTGQNANLYYGYACSALVKQRNTNANYYTYSIEFVHCAKGDITDAQIAAAVELIKTVIIPHMKKNGVTPKIDREHIIGHCDVTPKTRAACPGVNFPYDKIIAGVFGSAPVTNTAQKKETETRTIAYLAAVRAKPSSSVWSLLAVLTFRMLSENKKCL